MQIVFVVTLYSSMPYTYSSYAFAVRLYENMHNAAL
jgi:hypothetical protein